MVAEVRSGHYSRQGEQIEISLGTWQIALKRAIADYLKSRSFPDAANLSLPIEGKEVIS
jgi:hypothetical protein